MGSTSYLDRERFGTIDEAQGLASFILALFKRSRMENVSLRVETKRDIQVGEDPVIII